MIWLFEQLEAKKSNGHQFGLCVRLEDIYLNIDNLDLTRHGPNSLVETTLA